MLEFQASIPTVASDFQLALSDEDLTLDDLIKKFGHLRPGTYDVNQLAYWEKPEFYFVRTKQSNLKQEFNTNNFVFTKKEFQGFQNFLNKLPADINVDNFVQYLEKAIQYRECTKFVFTRNLSTAIDLIIKYGTEELNLRREDVGFLTFDDIKGLRKNNLNKNIIKTSIKMRKMDYSEKHLAKLPSFISSQKDFYAYEQEKSEINFITRLNGSRSIIYKIK